MLKLINVRKEYKTTDDIVVALRGININFRENEFVTILGPSGCGKTTLLNIVGGLDKYSDGELLINGISTKDYKDSDWDAYRNHSVGFVFQNYNLISHLSVLENVEMSLTLCGVDKEERKAKAIEALEKVGLKDKLNKKPNQLSGGQMQRVAIARAIVNNPSIVLADEPTGSLDSKTSIQIMDILKEISKERLVIMVTHNPDLAKEYSTRIINLLDGQVTSDSNVYDSEKETNTSIISKKRPVMRFLTALSLSLKNLLTKKIRTSITILATSIGIMGVALVLALSNGLNKCVDKLQNDTLSTYPLTISTENTINLNDLSSTLNIVGVDLERYPTLKEVYMYKANLSLDSIVSNNNITQEYIEDVIENINPDLINGIKYERDVEINLFTNNGAMKQVSNGNDMHVKLVTDLIWQQMIDNENFLLSQYDVIEGSIPNKYNEIAVVVDRYNRLTDATLLALGLYTEEENKKVYTFDELMNTEFKLLTNDEMYYWNGSHYDLDGVYVSGHPMITNNAYNKGETIKVVGIIRTNEDTVSAAYRPGIVYTNKLIDHIVEKNKTSSLGNYLENNVNINPFTGVEYVSNSTDVTVSDLYQKDLKKYGVDNTPTSIYIYPKSYEAKEEIKVYLDKYNDNKTGKQRIVYTDVMSLLIGVIEFMVNGVSNVMITISAISLIVSSIMIGIITYASVIERTREIGVLRSLGARKKDVVRVFNAETFIIGVCSALLGLSVALIITVPINIVMGNLVVGMGNVARLSLYHIVVLVLISILLTVVSGFIPAKIASRRDPVNALRSI